jgi:hypothetical protein
LNDYTQYCSKRAIAIRVNVTGLGAIGWACDQVIELEVDRTKSMQPAVSQQRNLAVLAK